MTSRDPKLSTAYLRFNNLRLAIEGVTSGDILDEVERRLLDLIAWGAVNGEEWTVTRLMESEIASPATVHKRLSNLKARGFVRIEPAKQYPRKDVVLTEKAVDYYNRLAEAMRDAVRHPK